MVDSTKLRWMWRGGRSEAGARRKGTGLWRPAPREGMGPGEAGAREREGPSRPRPWQAVAVAETAGIVGSGGPGTTVRRIRDGRVTGSMAGRHGTVTEPGPREEDAR